MALLKLEDILERAKKRESRRIVIAAAEDLYVLQAVIRARAENIVKPAGPGRYSHDRRGGSGQCL